MESDNIKKPNTKVRTLKLFNGRSHGSEYKEYHVYVAAYSQKQAAELVSMACFGKEHKDLISLSEITKYYHKGTWGNSMNGIIPVEPCVYICKGYSLKEVPFRVI